MNASKKALADEWCMRYVLTFGPEAVWRTDVLPGEPEFILAMCAALAIPHTVAFDFIRRRTRVSTLGRKQ